MKIAMICTEKLPVPPVAGGAIQMYIDGVLPYLSKQHDITVFCVQHPSLPDEEEKDNVKYVRVPGKAETLYLNNVKERLGSGYDLIHIFNRPRFLLALSDAMPEARFSLSLHNEMFHPEKLPEESALRCVERAEFINTVSRYIADTVVLRVPSARTKLHVVYSGVDPLRYEPGWTADGAFRKQTMKAKYGLGDYRVILYVGRLSIKKGVHVLLKAMETVMGVHKDTALVIAGSKWYGKNDKDDYTNSIWERARRLPNPVIFTGFVPPSQIPDYYSMGDIFVCASQWNEPLARVHYEAMAAGLPFITTNRGGNAEIAQGLGNGVVLNEFDNPDAMAQSICELLGDREKAAAMGAAGRALAEDRFNWQRVASEIFAGGASGAAGAAGAGGTSDTDAAAGTGADDEAMQNKAVQYEAVKDEAVPGGAVPDETAQYEAVHKAVQYEAVKAEAVPSGAVPDETAPSEAIPDGYSLMRILIDESVTAAIGSRPPLDISIIGTGYVGLVTGACLASTGHNVYCYDKNKQKILSLKNGILPIYEPCLDSIVDNCANKQKRLMFTTDIKEAVQKSDIIFISVNTPTLEDDTCDTSHVFEVARDIALNMDRYKVIVNKSTVPVGTGRKVKSRIAEILRGQKKSLEFDVVSNPEFLKEGTAVEDFINPDRIVIGADSERAANIIKEVYRDQITSDIPALITGIEEAEMIKYASNAFLAAKVSFINEIANICELCGIDVGTVAKGAGLDKRIGKHFLSPGPGFGGSCFPKDVRALVGLSREFGYEPLLLESVLEVNSRQKKRMIQKIKNVLGGLEGRRIAVLGLAFKPGTDDIRESPSLTILPALIKKKAIVSVYDPQAMENMKKEYPLLRLNYREDAYSACEGCDCAVLVTEWKDFSSLDFGKLKAIMKKPVFLDLRNVYTPEYVRSFGFYYEGVGKK